MFASLLLIQQQLPIQEDQMLCITEEHGQLHTGKIQDLHQDLKIGMVGFPFNGAQLHLLVIAPLLFTTTTDSILLEIALKMVTLIMSTVLFT
jgi:hypothetical protein